MSDKTLDILLRDYTHTFFQQAHKFRKQLYDLSWLLADSSNYWPSYQSIYSSGKHPITRSLNRLIGRLSLFGHINSTKINKKLFQYYILPLQQKGIKFTHIQTFWKSLAKLINSNWQQIHLLSYAELFSLLNTCTRLYFDSINLDADLYSADKQSQNTYGLQFYLECRDALNESTLSFKGLVYLVIKSNWIDNYNFDPSPFLISFLHEINDVIDNKDWLEESISSNRLFFLSNLEQEIHGPPKTFLYEVDNCGEIFFDLLLIEYILTHKHNVILSLKSKPILNDITYENFQTIITLTEMTHFSKYLDTKQFQFIKNETQDVIPIRYLANTDYIKAYKAADCVILKGQGHFESYPKYNFHGRHKTPITYNKTHYHLFGIKSQYTHDSILKMYPHCVRDQLILLR